MATIREVKKKGKIISYCFTVSLGRDKQGKQIRKNLTWKPTEGMTPAKARKAAERAAAEWELEVRGNNQQRIEEKNQVQTVQNILLERKDDFVSFVNDTWFSLFICNGDRKETTIDAWVFVFWSKSVSAKRGTNIFNIVVFQLLAVGFKVNNERAVQFRKWANTIVKDYTIKGWVMDDERLKNGGSIRRLPISTPQPWTTTRRRRQPRGVAKEQHKMYFAVHGHTAVEDRAILTDAGSITAEIAKSHAETEFEKYRIIQDQLYESDFDRFLAMENN